MHPNPYQSPREAAYVRTRPPSRLALIAAYGAIATLALVGVIFGLGVLIDFTRWQFGF